MQLPKEKILDPDIQNLMLIAEKTITT